jgi:hypothetical protein
VYTVRKSSIPPECRFIKSNGRRCHSPAMRGVAYCYFHQLSRRGANGKGRPQKPFNIELPADDESGQSYRNSLARLRQAVAEGRLDHVKARLSLYAINIFAATNKIAPELEMPPDAPPR